jgi:hypothetical protein
MMSFFLVANNFEARGNFERALSIKKDIYNRAIINVGFEHRYAVLAGVVWDLDLWPRLRS